MLGRAPAHNPGPPAGDRHVPGRPAADDREGSMNLFATLSWLYGAAVVAIPFSISPVWLSWLTLRATGGKTPGQATDDVSANAYPIAHPIAPPDALSSPGAAVVVMREAAAIRRCRLRAACGRNGPIPTGSSRRIFPASE